MAPVFLLTALVSYCIWSLRRVIKRRKENRGSARIVLIRDLECADKNCFLPN